MPATADLKFSALRAQGFLGAGLDMELQWLQDAGATSDNLRDAWREALDLQGYSALPHIEDAWYAFLGDQGFTGSMRDREYLFWLGSGAGDGGIFPTGTRAKILIEFRNEDSVQLRSGEFAEFRPIIDIDPPGGSATFRNDDSVEFVNGDNTEFR